MSDNILISVVIPVYNTPAEKLSRCLDSVCADDTTAYEVILVDDGSCQELSVQYQKICEALNDIRYYRKENSGAGLARNYGVEKAKGEYVTFVDADDYISPHCFNHARSMIEKFQPDLVIGLKKIVYESKENAENAAISNQVMQSNVQMFSSDDERARLLGNMLCQTDPSLIYPDGYLGHGPVAKVFRREIFSKIKFDDKPFWSEDTVWNIQMIKACSRIIVCAEPWYFYVMYSRSITHGYRKNCMEEFLYRTQQEFNVMEKVWGQVSNGLYLCVWNELNTLCETMIFHPENRMTEKEKYRLLKQAIQSDPYQRAIKNLSFNYPQNWIIRCVKEFLRFSMSKGWYPLCYLIVKFKIKHSKYWLMSILKGRPIFGKK